MKRSLLTLTLLIALFTLILGGCAKAPKNDDNTAENTTYPLTVTDQLGREVIIEKEPEKIVSGYYISTSLLIALDLQDKTVGIESKPEKRPIYQLAAPEFLELPNVGTMKEFNLEATIALEPDLVILPVKLKDNIDALEELGIKVIAINPESNELLHEMITIVSKATDTVERGNDLIAAINKYSEKIDTILKEVEAKKVYLGGNSEFLSTAGSKMYQNTLITLAKGENVAGEIEDAYWANVSYEQLLTWNPEVIILASDAEYGVDDVLNDENIQEVTAVQNKAVVKIPSNLEAWDSPVPSSILGSLWIASVLYPDEYSQEDFNKDVQEFYSTFYGLENITNE